MLQTAQDMLKVLQSHVRNTLHAVADLAQSVGAPRGITSFIQSLERLSGGNHDHGPLCYSVPPIDVERSALHSPPADAVAESDEIGSDRTSASKRRPGFRDLPEGVRPLGVDDAINGSTYLARIVWALGVSTLEGTGALRPADMARMIMARSPVSLEPPNVARYIRRSKPTSVAVDHIEGSSSFYKLNAEGLALFDEKFRIR